jgi:hypothetical protein
MDARGDRSPECTVFSAVSLPEIHMEKDKEQVVETAVEARGGFLARPVLLVLIASVALA